jgi:preprotein translocase subunit SecA
MMDRIEDETIKFLFFMQPYEVGDRDQPPVPYPEMLEDEEEEEEVTPDPPVSKNGTPNGQNGEYKAAQNAFQDVTRNIQRKKERELAGIQFAGGDGSDTTSKPVVNSNKVGRNDPCPCGSGKKYKKCHGVTS